VHTVIYRKIQHVYSFSAIIIIIEESHGIGLFK
jgi:hypothetical protein